MNDDLVYRDTCTIYEVTPDDYGSPQLGDPTTVSCLFVQTTAYQHSANRDTITGISRLVLPGQDPFVTAHSYRLEEMVVEVNPFGDTDAAQMFKITSVTPVRDLLLFNTVHHVECDLKKVQTGAYVS